MWTQNVLGSFGSFGLFFLAFIESIFFPIPTDVLLIILTIQNPSFWFGYAFIATIGSVLGAAVAYTIGYFGGRAILERYFHKYIARVHAFFQKYETLAVFIAGFTPIPYKVFALAAGVFYVDFKKFILVSLLARGLRFFLVAGIVALASHLPAAFNWICLALLLFVIEFLLAKKIWFS